LEKSFHCGYIEELASWLANMPLIVRSVGEKKCRCIQMDFSKYVV